MTKKKTKKPARRSPIRKAERAVTSAVATATGGALMSRLGATDATVGVARVRSRDVTWQVRLPAALRDTFVRTATAAHLSGGAIVRDAMVAWLASRGVAVSGAVSDPRQLALPMPAPKAKRAKKPSSKAAAS